jgi:hypothetical protein
MRSDFYAAGGDKMLHAILKIGASMPPERIETVYEDCV